jgi:hypothetical protein
MTLEQLTSLLESGQFHHATYRELNTIWEGLYIYANDPDLKWVGYRLVGSFNKADGLSDAAYEMVRHTGVSLGSRGNG